MSNDLIKKDDDIIKKIQDKALASKVSSLKDKLSNINKYKNLTLLCDVSGSMASQVGTEQNVRAIDVVNDVIQNFSGAEIWEFSSQCRRIVNNKLSPPLTSTNMGRAFATIKNNGVKEIVLLTDGQPDSEDDALTNAQGLIINIIYIGPHPIPTFLQKLARMTKGKFEDVELILKGASAAKELENKIKGFLNA
jgi:hypothetical protein